MNQEVLLQIHCYEKSDPGYVDDPITSAEIDGKPMNIVAYGAQTTVTSATPGTITYHAVAHLASYPDQFFQWDVTYAVLPTCTLTSDAPGFGAGPYPVGTAVKLITTCSVVPLTEPTDFWLFPEGQMMAGISAGNPAHREYTVSQPFAATALYRAVVHFAPPTGDVMTNILSVQWR